MNHKIPKEMYTIDSGFREIAKRDYTKRQLERLGAEVFNGGAYLVIHSQDEYRGIDLIFEKDRKDRRWKITDANRRRIFNDTNVDPREYLDLVIEGMERSVLTTPGDVVHRLKHLREIM
ncbi:MAG: hypothetical protein KKG75_03060 [Nanoarchaeota archaeon]|nr:hypothetical protein [Nanoarchaeota archaeon]